MQPTPYLVPVLAEVGSLSVEEELLQRLVEFPDDLFFGDSHVALEALNYRVGRGRYRIGQLGLATSWRTFHQQWLAHARRQIHHLQRDGIDDVACRTQLRGEFACRREHVGFLSSCKLQRKRSFCICWFVGFTVIRQSFTLVRSHVGSVGAKRRMCLIGCKAMILFARGLVSAELRPRSNRELQKSEIYFTNHTLTGKLDAFPRLGFDCQAIPQAALSVTPSFAGCSPSLFHQSHFDWEGTLFVAGSGLCQAIPQAALSVTPSFDGCSPSLFYQSHF